MKDATVRFLDRDEEMKRLAYVTDDHCIGLPGIQLVTQASIPRCNIL